MALSFSFKKEPSHLVLFEGVNNVRKVIMNNVHKLNSLNYEMISTMTKKLREYEEDPNVKIVILRGNGKAFCAGGDISSVVCLKLAGNWTYSAAYYAKQLSLHYLVATYQRPVVSLINGIVMGGGAGLSMNTPFRIVTEKTVFSMPEASIGIYPDVGASYFLSRLPGYFGEYLGLTGARLNGIEMLYCGLATHFVHSKDLPLLEAALENMDSDTSTIASIVNKFSQKPFLKEDSPYMRMVVVNKCFSKSTVEEILQALQNEANNNSDKFIVTAVNSINQACPLSLKIFLRLIREGRRLTLDECLNEDHKVISHMLSAKITNNFYEGSRAKLFDKDMKPKWEPSKLDLVSEELVDQHFIPIDDEDFIPLRLPPVRGGPFSQEFSLPKARL